MRRMYITSKRGERGSALLIVFLLAAVLAISLYMEMPTVAFEAKRTKEQLLIDRGNEYAHAVKLYYRRFRAYPASIDALENTNRIRFLRHKYKDPMTGEDNWRLLHAGPGGQLTDSKVNPINPNGNGQNPSGSGTNNNNNSATNTPAFANSFVTPTDAGGQPTVAALPQRPPEMPMNGGGAAASTGNVDPTQSLLAPSGAQPVPAQPGGAPATQMQSGSLPPNQAVQPLQQMQQTNGGSAANPMQGVQGLFSNPNPPAGTGAPATAAPMTNAATPGAGTTGTSSTTSTTTAQSGMGVVQSGGLAGVASVAKGKSIKTVNDQTDYSLWEFWYDPTKDTSLVGNSGMNGANGATQQTGTSPTGLAPANSPNTTTPAPSTTSPTPGATTPPPQP